MAPVTSRSNSVARAPRSPPRGESTSSRWGDASRGPGVCLTVGVRIPTVISSRRARLAGVLALLVAGLTALVPVSRPGGPVAEAGAAPLEQAGAVVQLLPIQTKDRRLVDTAGRDVLLRGANVNSLGEYWQGVPGLDPTIPLSAADYDEMAARGFSVVRLLITWSRVEPAKGTFDAGYLDQVDAVVTELAAHGIYSVIDMHQDAYTAFISTPDPAVCPAGTTPAKGWDGAPAWAVLTDGLSTCLTNGERNSSPAVNRAWNNFYDNVNGIRDEFALAWFHVAERFRGRPEVAGYDVLNEPENPRPADQMKPVYNDFLADVISSIRSAEAPAAFDHVIFVEPAIPAGDPTRGLVIPDPVSAGVGTENISGSVHNYAESINVANLTIEQTNGFIDLITKQLGVPNWGGEYGFWDTSDATLAKARRYAADEDKRAWGGAWWQWRQSCGDPHAVFWSGAQVLPGTGVSTHLNLLGCPGNVDQGPNDAFLDILGRGYPRATPGKIKKLTSDPATGLMRVDANVGAPGGQLVVWTPTVDDAGHRVNTTGLTDVVAHEVAGGRIVTATVAAGGDYALWIGPAQVASTTTTTPRTVMTATPLPPPAPAPVVITPAYAG